MNGNSEKNALTGAYGSTCGLLKYAPEESVTITFERRKYVKQPVRSRDNILKNINQRTHVFPKLTVHS